MDHLEFATDRFDRILQVFTANKIQAVPSYQALTRISVPVNVMNPSSKGCRPWINQIEKNRQKSGLRR